MDAALPPVTERFFPGDEHFMHPALREAERALTHDDLPIGAEGAVGRYPVRNERGAAGAYALFFGLLAWQ